MNTVQFVISKLNGDAAVDDLGTAITGISGVAGIRMDMRSHMVSVEYDPAFVNPAKLKSSIESSGYPIDRVNEQ